MKTNLTLLILFSCFIGFGQIPSINQVNTLQKRSFEKKRNVAEELPLPPQENLDQLTTPQLKEKIKNQNTQIDSLKTELNKDNIYVVDNYISKYDKLIEGKKGELKKQKNEQARQATVAKMDSIQGIIDGILTHIETLKNEKNQKVINHSYSWFLPTLAKKNRSYFFETMYNNSTSKTQFLNSFGVSGNSYGIAAQSELITDNMAALRIAFGTVIAASNDDEADDDEAPENETNIEALDRLVNGGGNFYLEITLPLATTINKNNSDLITAYSYMSVRGATDIKGYGNDLDTSTGNGSGGLYLYLGFSSESRKFNFFLQGNGNYCMGSKDFYNNLGIEHNNGFFNGKLIAGLTLENKFRFTANFFTFGSEPSLRREKITLGFQFLP